MSKKQINKEVLKIADDHAKAKAGKQTTRDQKRWQVVRNLIWSAK